jgi:hypothetical protein
MSRITRKQLLQYGAGAGVALMIPWRLAGRALALTPAFAEPTLPGGDIPKYQSPVVIPPAMPRTRRFVDRGRPIDYYEIAVRQFQQQILPSGFPETTVWSYGSVNHPGSFNYPAFTIEARVDSPCG